MESAAVLRSFNCSVGTVSRVRSILNLPSMVAVHNVSWPTLSKSHIQGFALGGKLVSYPAKQEEVVVSCATTSETTVATDSDVLSDSRPQGLLEKNSLRGATFPNGFEALVLQVCDETEVAELKLKGHHPKVLFKVCGQRDVACKTKGYGLCSRQVGEIDILDSWKLISWPEGNTKLSQGIHDSLTVEVGEFEMRIKQDVSATIAPTPVVSPPTFPPASSSPIIESAPVGSFRKGRTVKGRKLPPACLESHVIEEGQVIGFLDQFGKELPVRSDVAGEVLKVFFDEGDAVGYGDPLIGVLPSFPGIK
ncbi:biotin/lipoyl attachment domain-containing protein [Actinidia rufa]|uniref:Biotin/lipoyl attachment domain-containing protein n=1 Tax=Actinidia rufa TaxID=165716 RepID=A0A7J0EAH7_9ERIC|nr:biotin/lipoyl attachment domain-containing protein [Actinidia rufa]